MPLNLAQAEDLLIERAITAAGGNYSAAARLLGVNRALLYRWQQRRGTGALLASPAAEPAPGL